MKIVYLMGKSASGKDTVYQILKEQAGIDFQPIVMYTTRPVRDHEVWGREYYFIDEKEACRLEQSDKLIEERIYNTVYGPWKYMTVDDGQFREDGIYLTIGTLESYNKIRQYFGQETMLPVYLEIDDGLRLERAIAREKTQKVPKYEEMCRRFLADQADFSEDKLQAAGITRRFDNLDKDACVKEIIQYFKENIKGEL